ncbi:MAG: phosphatase PAP2 family protein [Bacteroidota bacterium]
MKDFSIPRRESLLAEYFERKPLLGLLLVTVLTAFSYRFLDAAISSFVAEFIRANELTSVVSGLPDLLDYIVAVITAGCWVGFFHLTRRGFDDNHTRFLKLCGTTVPLAYLVKMIFQYLFGRSTPEMWVVYHLAPQFHWFRADHGYGCFPSGHMTVFTALGATLWRHYPRYKPAYLGFLLALALALVATNYHFLSDVLAGTYLGAMICFLADRAVGRPRKRS